MCTIDAKELKIARLSKENEALKRELATGNKSIALYWVNVGINFLEGATDESSLSQLRILKWLRSNIDGTNPYCGWANEKLLRKFEEDVDSGV